MTDAEQPNTAPEARSERESRAEFETPAEIRAEVLLLERAIGGVRGMIDSSVPTVVFVIAYLVTSSNLTAAVLAALAAGLIVAAWRAIRHEPLRQVCYGFVGVAVSALFAKYTGKAENYFLPGFLQNLGYGLAFLISILVRWPLIGVAMGFLTGEGTRWRSDPPLRRVYSAASWIWVGLFFGRLVVQVPLYFAGTIAALGVMKIVMGIPLYVGAAYLTYRLLRPVWVAKRGARAAALEPPVDQP